MNTRRKPHGYIVSEHIHHAINANTTVTRTVAAILSGTHTNLTQALGNVAAALIDQRQSLDLIRDITAKQKAAPAPTETASSESG